MYLKINFDNATKKVMFKDELRTEAAFFDLLERFTKLKRSDFIATFTDAEEDTVPLTDQFDLDYFVTDGQSRNFMVVNVESREKAGKPLEEAKLASTSADVPIGEMSGEPLHPIIGNLVHNLQNLASLPLFFGQRQTSEMNIQTETPATNEKCSETVACQQTNAGQQTQVSPQKSKETQTKEKEVAPSSELKVLSERIEALERSFLQQSLSQVSLQPEQAKVVKEETPLSKTQVTTSHIGITCDGCKKWPIVGKRYKCLVCNDFDLCQTCEEKNDHSHPMVRCSSQVDSFLLERVRRKFVKVSGQGTLRGPNEERHAGRFRGGLRGLFGKGKLQPSMNSETYIRCPFQNDPSNTSDQLKGQTDSNLTSKQEMLQFMLPDHPHLWPQILEKYGYMGLSEFCALVSLYDPVSPN